jgi:hypothetical protein
MRIVPLRKHLLAAGAVLALTPFLLTAAPAVPEKPKTSPAEKIRADLDQTISIEIADQSFDKALEQLREQTKLNIVFDRMTVQMVCQQMGLQGPEQMPINLKLKDVKVKSALRSILAQANLGYAIIGDTVFVSTEPMVMYKQLQQRVSLDCDKQELSAALKQLGRETATNLVVDPRAAKDAKMEVSLQMEDVPLETAVRLLSEMAGLKPVRVGNVLFVTTKANAQEMRSDPELVQPNQGGRPGVDFVVPGQPGGVIQFNPGIGPGGGVAPGVPGIGTVPVNPPPAPEDKKADPGDKPDKSEKPDKIEKDKGEKEKPEKEQADKPKPDQERGKPTVPPPPGDDK